MKSLFLPFACCLLLLNLTSGSCKKNDDGTPLTGVSVIETSTLEDAAEVLVSVKLQKSVEKTVIVQYATEDGSAKASEDYTALSGELTFAPGETEHTIKMTIVADTLREADEVFYVKILSAGHAEIVTGINKVTLRNDDTFVLLTTAGFESPVAYPGYQLNWSDEFAGASLNTTDWGFDLGDGCPNCGWGNNELEWYTNRPENVFLSGGRLFIEARKESIGGKEYSSSRIKTQGKKSFKYGRIDIRALLPVGQGIWPAIWMLGDNITSVNWPACGEIDIMEYLGHEPNTMHGTGHWGVDFSSHQYKGSSIMTQGANFSQEWHVFSIIWKEDEITWLMDDQPFFNLTPAITGSSYPFNNSFFFIFNLAVGGNWPGNPNAATTFPQRLAVDYVRVFEKI